MKKIFTFFLALVASVGIASAAITVRLDPSSCSSWSTVRLWAWTSAGNVFNAWPGEIVGTDTDGWYAYTFDESITEVSIIWNNGTAQTVDITGITASTCYALNSTSGTAITVRVVDCPSNPDPQPQTIDHVQIGSLYYNLDGTNRTAEVTYEERWGENNYAGLTSVDIPSSVTYNNYTYSVTSIGEQAFAYCSSLTSVTIPNSVTSIGDWAFGNCSSLTSVTIPNSVTSIGDRTFYGCISLTSITIPNSVTSIGDWAFGNCSSLTSVTIPNSVTSIGDRTFYGCISLTSVTIPNSVTSIGENAFYYCSSLTSVTIPNSVTSIGDRAFYVCSSLTSITIPNSVTSIGEYAFEGCWISSINFLGTLADWCNKLWSTSLMIAADKYYTLSINGVLQTDITIPNSVTSIGDRAFSSCSSLTSVTMQSETPPALGNNVFDHGVSIYVPCGSLDAYRSADKWNSYWSNYGNNIRYTPSPYTITTKAENGYIWYSKADEWSEGLSICDETLTLTAGPDRGCYFVKWADGNTDNTRTIELTQDTTMEAFFDYLPTGKCGKDEALTWTFDSQTKALEITGAGELTENYTYTYNAEAVTIGNEITIIGEDAFYGCKKIKSIIIGSSVKVIEHSAFMVACDYTYVEGWGYEPNGVLSQTITCYSQRPPTVKDGAFYGYYELPYSTIIYVPADYLATYKAHDFWGMYDVRPLGAVTVETSDVKVTPTETTADVVWPAVSGAATYELVIKDKNGNVICTLIFNANGQLTQIAFNAPARDNAVQTAGFSFTVTGLEEGTSYNLTITAKDGNGSTLDEKTMAFTTAGGTGVEDINAPATSESSTKIFRNGEVFILRGGKTYTIQGVKVK